MRKTLNSIIAGTALLSFTACSTSPSYHLPTFQQISSTAQSCEEVGDSMTFHNVKINDFISEPLEQRVKWPIVISGRIPTTDYSSRRIATAIERWHYDKELLRLEESILTITEKHFGSHYTEEERKKKLRDGLELTRELIAESLRHDGIVLYAPDDVYTKSATQYVEAGKLKGEFTVHGNLGCLTKAEFTEAEALVDAVAETFGYSNLQERVAFIDLLRYNVGTLIKGWKPNGAPTPNLLLYLKVTGIKKIGY